MIPSPSPITITLLSGQLILTLPTGRRITIPIDESTGAQLAQLLRGAHDSLPALALRPGFIRPTPNGVMVTVGKPPPYRGKPLPAPSLSELGLLP